ncbi:MAG: hypothetical protein CMJ34_11600 [Phycisphaerae bacterium]|nr:hypothetical protein [Phycisphaerae bacterium]
MPIDLQKPLLRFLRPALLGIGAVVLLPVSTAAPAPQDEVVVVGSDREVADEVAAWRDDLWQAALEGRLDDVDAHFASIPAGADADRAASLRMALEARTDHEAATIEDREEGRRKAAEEIREALDEQDLTEALTAAIELQTLSDDWNAVLEEPVIQELVRTAEEAEEGAREQRDWLFVQEILFRLRTLHEDTDRKDGHERYDQRLDEVNRRIGLLARYAPRSLHELRRMQVDRIDPETEFPEFNEAFAEDWKVPLQGITEKMVNDSLRRAASMHISACGWKPLLDGGLEALEIFASTEQLGENFPNLSESERTEAWLDVVRRERTRLAEIPADETGRRDYNRIMRELFVANGETIDVQPEVIYREFGEGATYRLEDQYEDQYTQIIWPEQLRRFQQQVQGDFVGVGILIRHNDKRELMVQNPLEGSPASRAGVEEKDLIISVSGVPTTGWSLNRAVDEITGPRGEEVVLTVSREDEEEPIDIPIVRDRIKIRSVNGWYKTSLEDDGTPQWDWFIDESDGIGYVRLTSFNDESYEDFLSAVAQMREVRPLEGLILDLRFNPGGLLDSAIRFSNHFVSEGGIVSCEDRDGRTVWERPARGEAPLEGLPLVVLVNQGSASASEIVSGCLQAHSAAVVIGERTFGKGSVQTVHDVSDRRGGPAAFKLTNQYYALPPAPGEERGRLVHKMPGAEDWGVNPDLVVEMTPDQTQDAYELRRKSDLIADWDEDRDPADRPRPDALVGEGIDAQLETAVLLLKARLLLAADDPRMVGG